MKSIHLFSLLIFAGLLSITACNPKPTFDRDQLVETYMHHPFMEGMSTGIEKKNLVADIFKEVLKKNYQGALDLINPLEYEKNNRLYNMKAISLMGLHQFDEAEEIFLGMKNNPSSPAILQYDASWHLMLLYLLSSKDELYNKEIKSLLKDSSGLYYQDAKALYEKTGDL
ncbi:MAG: hypothetical protein KDC24_09155 [Saprospiraceae bacterium]|nr:hypothetical protein [Saprospiraceae bacterium]